MLYVPKMSVTYSFQKDTSKKPTSGPEFIVPYVRVHVGVHGVVRGHATRGAALRRGTGGCRWGTTARPTGQTTPARPGCPGKPLFP